MISAVINFVSDNAVWVALAGGAALLLATILIALGFDGGDDGSDDWDEWAGGAF